MEFVLLQPTLKGRFTHFITDPAELKNAHIVVTTYDTVKSEYNVYNPADDKETDKKSKAKKKSLDESDSDSDSDARPAIKRPARASRKKDALLKIRWWRIVLGMSTDALHFVGSLL